jgi:hypothetical protein
MARFGAIFYFPKTFTKDRTIILNKATLILLALLCSATAAAAQKRIPIKHVAVVETELDEQSGAASEISKPEVREMTAMMRREAADHLPIDRYNVMTTETVLAMGAEMMGECAEENCVVALGSKIGADYIVRGIISKFQSRFTLNVEIYETEYGNLITSSKAVRSENLEDVLEKGTAACADMYRDFVRKVDARIAAKAKTEVAPEPESKPEFPSASEEPIAESKPEPKHEPAPEITSAPNIEPDPKPTPEFVSIPKPKKPIKPSFWIGLSADAIGAGLVTCGFIVMDAEVKNTLNDEYNENRYSDAKKAAKRRDALYGAGAVILLSGISVHIFF